VVRFSFWREVRDWTVLTQEAGGARVPRMIAAAVLLAGGSGLRAGSTINKVYLRIGGRQMLSYPLEVLDRSRLVGEIVLVVRSEDRKRAEAVVTSEIRQTPLSIVDGGVTRQESELRGLEALGGTPECVAIHDGARPFLPLGLLESVIETARRVGGAIPGYVPDQPLFREVEGQLEPMNGVQAVQTPQCFRAEPLVAAYREAKVRGFEGVDTAETIERFTDLVVAVVPGDPRAFKVTFEEDLARAEQVAATWDPSS
jgi:2-C-methyl-D-erythritol 4-phosphate cytidylyltransferase